LRQRITADKREIKDFPKLPSATSFIRNPLCAMLVALKNERNKNRNIKGEINI